MKIPGRKWLVLPEYGVVMTGGDYSPVEKLDFVMLCSASNVFLYDTISMIMHAPLPIAYIHISY